MTNSKSTKGALLVSSISLLLCFAMLLGTTFAWFTDSATSANNVIKAGNLDVEVQYTLDGENWAALDGAKDLFQKGLWEPGHTEVVALRIENKGSLALKYTANMNIVDEKVGKTKDGKDIVLSDILTVDSMIMDTGAMGDALLKVAFQDENTLQYTNTASFKNANVLGKDDMLLSGTSKYLIVKVDMAETVGNEANHNGTDIPTINFGINVLATQFTHEDDSFGKDYDEDAEYPPIAWDGSVDTSWFDASKNEFTISNGAQLAGMATLGNQLGGKTITLDSNVDLGGKNWTPITIFDPEHPFTFDGGNHTISNLNVTSGSDKGMFDNSVGTIKNLKLSDAQIKSSGRSAILAGKHYGDIINCHVKDSTVEDSYWAAGGIVGLFNSGNIKNCSVTGCIFLNKCRRSTIPCSVSTRLESCAQSSGRE